MEITKFLGPPLYGRRKKRKVPLSVKKISRFLGKIWNGMEVMFFDMINNQIAMVSGVFNE